MRVTFGDPPVGQTNRGSRKQRRGGVNIDHSDEIVCGTLQGFEVCLRNEYSSRGSEETMHYVRRLLRCCREQCAESEGDFRTAEDRAPVLRRRATSFSHRRFEVLVTDSKGRCSRLQGIRRCHRVYSTQTRPSLRLLPRPTASPTSQVPPSHDSPTGNSRSEYRGTSSPGEFLPTRACSSFRREKEGHLLR